MSLVFISYRECDEPWVANWLYTELSECLGQDQVFLDHRSIRPGEEYAHLLLDRVRSSVALLAVIGSGWYGPDPGRRLVDNPADWVRREIGAAFAAGVQVLPVLVGNVPDLMHGDLPQDIRKLAGLQRLRLRPKDRHFDVPRVVAEVLASDPRLSGRVLRTSRQEIDRLVREVLPPMQQRFGGRGHLVDVVWSLLRSDDEPRFVALCRFSRRAPGSAVFLVTDRRIYIADCDGENTMQQVLTFGLAQIGDIEARRRWRAGVVPTADIVLHITTGDRILVRDVLRSQSEQIVDLITSRVP